mmetsp:Transcript_24342/g.41660  ORF Transcript_24342/g.41660 Transcript_24342/m.41660 type:complete len:211 (-) Transcript_24342:446-1078(-)
MPMHPSPAACSSIPQSSRWLAPSTRWTWIEPHPAWSSNRRSLVTWTRDPPPSPLPDSRPLTALPANLQSHPVSWTCSAPTTEAAGTETWSYPDTSSRATCTPHWIWRHPQGAGTNAPFPLWMNRHPACWQQIDSTFESYCRVHRPYPSVHCSSWSFSLIAFWSFEATLWRYAPRSSSPPALYPTLQSVYPSLPMLHTRVSSRRPTSPSFC